ncbi:MAG: Wzz/FepE/Etk N-terminal domain-containing protein [Candidatus Omnitrophica bacterium]|nr:Wzz/FepE/Etk N-terminal domain-containing protein [Candidatus Omnitrophota bacterium]
MTQEQEKDKTIGFDSIITLIIRWWVLILAITAFFVISALIYTLLPPKQYQAQAKLSFTQNRNNKYSIGDSNLSLHAALILSPDNLNQVAEKIGIDKTISIRQLKEKISLSVNQKEKTISVSAKDIIPEKALELANAIVESYVKKNHNSVNEQFDDQIETLEKQKTDINEYLLKLESEMIGFKQSHDLIAKRNQKNYLDSVIQNTKNNLYTDKLELAASDNIVKMLIEEMKTHQQYQKNKNESSLLDYDDLKKKLIEFKIKSTALKAKVDYQEAKLEENEKKSFKIVETVADIQRNLTPIQREKKTYLKNFNKINERLDLIKWQNQQMISEVKILNYAVLTFNSKAKVGRILLVWGFSGFLIGIFIALTLTSYQNLKKQTSRRIKQS